MYKPRTVDQPAELLPYLFAAWPTAKKKQVRTWLKHQAVLVNGRVVTQFNHALKPGDVVAIRSGRYAAPDTVIAAGIKVQFEDASLIIIDKPPDLLTIASEAEQEKTVYFQLTDYLRTGGRARERVWIVHRLDRETSGLMVFAKTPEAKRTLQDGWDKVEKRYQAVVEGLLPEDKGTFQSWLDETSPFKVFSVPRSTTTRHAVTHYRVLKRNRGRTLVELTSRPAADTRSASTWPMPGARWLAIRNTVQTPTRPNAWACTRGVCVLLIQSRSRNSASNPRCPQNWRGWFRACSRGSKRSGGRSPFPRAVTR